MHTTGIGNCADLGINPFASGEHDRHYTLCSLWLVLPPKTSCESSHFRLACVCKVSILCNTKTACLHAEAPQDIMDIFFSAEGIHSTDVLEQRAANLAISSAMADAPASIYPALHAALVTAVDHKAHDAISPTEVKIYFTPAGEEQRLDLMKPCCVPTVASK